MDFLSKAWFSTTPPARTPLAEVLLRALGKAKPRPRSKLPSKFVLAGGLCGAVVVYACYRGMRRCGWYDRIRTNCSIAVRSVHAYVIDSVARRVNHGRRGEFTRRMICSNSATPAVHSHPLAAASRSGCDYAMSDYIFATGKEPYDISTAARNRGSGSRFYYFTKDYHCSYRNDPVTSNHILKMVDVDYYLNNNELEYWLSGGNPLIMYTFSPREAGGQVPDGSYTISANKVKVVINGGATYEHEVWDWDVDTVTFETWFGVWICAVDMQDLGDGRRIVQVVPQVWVPAPFSLFVKRAPLKKRVMTFNDGDTEWSVVRTQARTGKQYLSVARGGSDYAVTLPAAAFDSMYARHRYAKSNRNVGDIQSHLDVLRRKEMTDCEPSIAAPLLYEYFESGCPPPKFSPQTLGGYATHYQSVAPMVLQGGRMYARNVGPKVIDGAYFGVLSKNNEILTVADRVKFPRNTVVPPPRYRALLVEFIKHLVPEIGGVTPWSVHDVMQIQDKPAQKSRNEHSRTWLFSNRGIVKAFQKREAAAKMKAPRNISTLPTDTNLKYATYVRAFKEAHLHKQTWYVPGMSPGVIAARVSRLARSSPYLLTTDFTNLDGSKSEFLRDIYRSCLLRAFPDDPDLIDILNSTARPKCVTRSGVLYDPGPSQLSGASDTTDNNTVAVAFWVYASLRLWDVPAPDAWSMLGDSLICGDDALYSCHPDVAARTSKELGLTLKIEQVSPGGKVKFLGRLFSNPWVTTTSVQDPLRTLSKIHTSVTDPQRVTPELALTWKAVGYLVNDSSTPIISNYCQMVLRIRGFSENPPISDAPDAVLPDLPWYSYCGEGTWPQSPTDELWAVVAEDLGILESEARAYARSLDKAKRLEDVTILRSLEPTVTATVTTSDGKLLEADPPPALEACRVLVEAEIHNAQNVGVQTQEKDIITDEERPKVVRPKKKKAKTQ